MLKNIYNAWQNDASIMVVEKTFYLTNICNGLYKFYQINQVNPKDIYKKYNISVEAFI